MSYTDCLALTPRDTSALLSRLTYDPSTQVFYGGG